MTGPTKKELEIVLKVKNDASKEMKRVGEEAQEVGRKAKKGAKEATDEFNGWERAAKRVGAAIKGLLNPLTLIGGAIGVGTIVSLAKGMSEAADQAEAVRGKFDLVFGERAKTYGANLDALATEIGRSRTELRDMAADMQIVAAEMLGSEDAAQAVTDAFVRLAIDVGELRNVADADVMAKFTQAVLGSGRALREFGVSITPAQIEAKALALGLAQTTEELTEQDKAVANINLIFEKLEYAQGEASRSSEEFGSRMKELAAVTRDVREEFGQRLNEAIVRGLDDAGGAQKVGELVKTFNAAIVEFARVGVATASELATAASKALDEFGGADGVIAWLQDRGNALVAEIRLFGAELALMAESFGQSVMRMLDRLKPALELLGLVQSGPRPSVSDMESERARIEAELAFRSANPGATSFAASGATVDLVERRRELDAQIEAARRLLELEEARARAREQLAAAQARVNAASAGDGGPGFFARAAGVFNSGLGSGGTSATGVAVDNAKAKLRQPDAPASRFTAAIQSLVPAFESARESLGRYIDTQERARQAQEAASRFAERQSGQLADAILGVATGAIKAKDALKQFLQGFFQDLLRQQVQAGVNSLLGGVFGAAFGAVNPVAAAANGAVFAGGLGSAVPVKGYATGGPIVRSPHVALIGEGKYNEAVVPLPDGRSIPVRMQGGSGGGTVNVSLTIQAADARSVTQLLADDESGFGSLVARAFTTNRDVNAVLRGRAV